MLLFPVSSARNIKKKGASLVHEAHHFRCGALFRRRVDARRRSGGAALVRRDESAHPPGSPPALPHARNDPGVPGARQHRLQVLPRPAARAGRCPAGRARAAGQARRGGFRRREGRLQAAHQRSERHLLRLRAHRRTRGGDVRGALLRHRRPEIRRKRLPLSDDEPRIRAGRHALPCAAGVAPRGPRQRVRRLRLAVERAHARTAPRLHRADAGTHRSHARSRLHAQHRRPRQRQLRRKGPVVVRRARRVPRRLRRCPRRGIPEGRLGPLLPDDGLSRQAFRRHRAPHQHLHRVLFRLVSVGDQQFSEHAPQRDRHRRHLLLDPTARLRPLFQLDDDPEPGGARRLPRLRLGRREPPDQPARVRADVHPSRLRHPLLRRERDEPRSDGADPGTSASDPRAQ